ncbi:unnamed protein product [Ectocarpus sp. CCAP 1310/34]|nr:unnamed protein product [Ectocarpus sp. CCAP 1310/34]
MLSCAILDTVVAGMSRLRPGCPSTSAVGNKGDGGGTDVSASEASPVADSNIGSIAEEKKCKARGNAPKKNSDMGEKKPPRDRWTGYEAQAAAKTSAEAGAERRDLGGHDRGSCHDNNSVTTTNSIGNTTHTTHTSTNASNKNEKAGPTGENLLRPYVIDLKAEISHAHPQILRLGETIHLFQPPGAPGGSWEEMEAVAWLIEQNPDGQVSIKYRVDPRGDRDMVEGCPLLKKIGGRKYVPVGLHLGRYSEKEWTHHGLLLLSGMHQMGEWLAHERVKKERTAEARIGGVKTSYRKLMQERTKAHLSDVVAEATVRSKPHANSGDGGGASSSKLVKLSPEVDDSIVFNLVAERRVLSAQKLSKQLYYVAAVLAIVTSSREVEVVRRPGLKALARLASDNRQTLLEIGRPHFSFTPLPCLASLSLRRFLGQKGRAGGIEASISMLRELGQCRDVQENGCWLLALLSQVAEFSRIIGHEGGCEEVCKVLKSCAKFGGACPRTQSWALGCLANLLGCRANRRRLLGVGRGWGEGATAMSEEEERPAGDRKPHQEECGEEDGILQQGEYKHLGEERNSRTSGERKGEREGSRGASWVQSGDNGCNDRTASGLGLPHWIHTVLANSDRVACDRGAQYSGIACVREIAAAGRAPARVMKSSGVPGLIGATIEKCATFGATDQRLRDQANSALRLMSTA